MLNYYLPDTHLGAKGVTVKKIDKNPYDGAYILAKKNKNKPKNVKNLTIVHQMICKCYKENQSRQRNIASAGEGTM